MANPRRARRATPARSSGPIAPIIATALLLLGGCSSQPSRDPEFAPVRPPEARAARPIAGAVYAAGHDIPLFEDIKAARVGDTLTILLSESTSATKSAETNTDKSTDFDIASPTVLGQDTSVKINGKTYSLETNLDADRSFGGAGDSSQSNSLSGEITVTVAEVLGNGNLLVRGEKIFTLNRGHEHIRISGVVRPYDITPENTVLSTQVAEARIIYTGEGEVADASAMGWLARFFQSPFFPF